MLCKEITARTNLNYRNRDSHLQVRSNASDYKTVLLTLIQVTCMMRNIQFFVTSFHDAGITQSWVVIKAALKNQHVPLGDEQTYCAHRYLRMMRHLTGKYCLHSTTCIFIYQVQCATTCNNTNNKNSLLTYTIHGTISTINSLQVFS